MATGVHDWTPAEIETALDRRDRALLNRLGTDLSIIAERGRHRLGRAWGYAALRHSLADDVQNTVRYFLERDGRILRKYGEDPYTARPGGFAPFICAVTTRFLSQWYTRDKPSRYEHSIDDMSSLPANGEAFRRREQEMDMERTFPFLTPGEQEFLRMLIDQIDKADICARLNISANAFEQRKSRLIAKLARFFRYDDRDKGDENHV